MTSKTRDYRNRLDEVLEDDAEAGAYRNAALAGLAEAAGLNREHLYRMLSENGNPELRSLEALLDALGFRLSVERKAAG